MKLLRSTRISAWLALLLLAASARAGEDLRLTLHGDAPIRVGTIQVEGLGALNVRAERQGPLVWIEARNRDGVLLGRAQSVDGVRETPLSVRRGADTLKLIVVIEGDAE